MQLTLDILLDQEYYVYRPYPMTAETRAIRRKRKSKDTVEYIVVPNQMTQPIVHLDSQKASLRRIGELKSYPPVLEAGFDPNSRIYPWSQD